MQLWRVFVKSLKFDTPDHVVTDVISLFNMLNSAGHVVDSISNGLLADHKYSGDRERVEDES
jgi:hypothetical protein